MTVRQSILPKISKNYVGHNVYRGFDCLLASDGDHIVICAIQSL